MIQIHLYFSNITHIKFIVLQSMLADFRARGGRIKLKQPVSPIPIPKEQDQNMRNGYLQTDKKVSSSYVAILNHKIKIQVF